MLSTNRFNQLIFVSGSLAIVSSLAGWFSSFALFKPLTTIIVIVFAITKASDLIRRDYVLLIGALIFSLLGDIALLFDSGFIYGLSSFLIAHLLFIVLFRYWAEQKLNWLATLCLAVVAAVVFTLLFPSLGNMSLPVSAYVTVIGLMAAWGCSAYLHESGKPEGLVMLGALVFLASDTALAINRFAFPFVLAPFVVLSLYWLALTLIVNGAVLKSQGVAQVSLP
ncbi:MAG: lysoplasmalogenase [Pseudomonadota bacterium]